MPSIKQWREADGYMELDFFMGNYVVANCTKLANGYTRLRIPLAQATVAKFKTICTAGKLGFEPFLDKEGNLAFRNLTPPPLVEPKS
jgi:hypothetical protein